MRTPAISFVVSYHQRPMELRCLLASLALQWDKDHETIVTDNSSTLFEREGCHIICDEFGVRYLFTGGTCHHCYESADLGATHARGTWLCFPCEDSYYVPGFSRIMLETARNCHWDFVYCDCVYDPRLGGKYSILDAQPFPGRIDKANFILRRELFQGFPPHDELWKDGALAVSLVRRGVRHGKAPGILCVHN